MDAQHATAEGSALCHDGNEHFALHVVAGLEALGTVQADLSHCPYLPDLLKQHVELRVTGADDLRVQSGGDQHLVAATEHFARCSECTGARGDKPRELIPVACLRINIAGIRVQVEVAVEIHQSTPSPINKASSS
ncbi:hypothetical protein D3C79_832890 [compost metagenome]